LSGESRRTKLPPARRRPLGRQSPFHRQGPPAATRGAARSAARLCFSGDCGEERSARAAAGAAFRGGAVAVGERRAKRVCVQKSCGGALRLRPCACVRLLLARVLQEEEAAVHRRDGDGAYERRGAGGAKAPQVATCEVATCEVATSGGGQRATHRATDAWPLRSDRTAINPALTGLEKRVERPRAEPARVGVQVALDSPDEFRARVRSGRRCRVLCRV
jgi:hypothetical protein